MPFGIDTSKRHLDELGAADWTALSALSGNDFGFVGRYLLGGRFRRSDSTTHDIDAVFQWAYGEGRGAPASVRFIVPIQAALGGRQAPARPVSRDELTAIERLTSRDNGRVDARRFCRRIVAGLAMGDFLLSKNRIMVFLEAEEGAELSADYWAGWSTEVMTHTFTTGVVTVMPFRPGIACVFVAEDGKFVPESGVRRALETVIAGPGGFNQCKGFWARTPHDEPSVTVAPRIDTDTFKTFEQEVFPHFKARVPVYLWQFTRSDGRLSALPGFGVSVSTSESEIDQWAMPLKVWEPAGARVLACGIDTNKNTASRVDCLATARIARPSSTLTNGRQIEFVARYYDAVGGSRRLSPVEISELSRVGLHIVTVWQASRDGFRNGWNPDGARYFAHRFDFGRADGLDACQVAQSLGQPARTPIYFAVDSLPGWSKPPDVPVPTETEVAQQLDDIADYFKGVAQGYIDYAAAAGDRAIPYDIGIYAAGSVIDAVYSSGVVSHFWQLLGWERDDLYHRHANFVQSDLSRYPDDTDPVGDVIRACTLDVDLDIAWGDPGSWAARPEAFRY